MKAIVENLLLAADQPVTLEHLRQTFSDKNDKAQLGEVLNELTADYQSKNLQITEVADGYQLCTRKGYFFCIDNDYIVTTISMRCEVWFVFTTNHLRHLACQTTYRLTFSIHYKPLLISGFLVSGNGFVT